MSVGTCQSCGRPASSSLFRCVECASVGAVPAPRIRIRVELGNVRTINLAAPESMSPTFLAAAVPNAPSAWEAPISGPSGALPTPDAPPPDAPPAEDAAPSPDPAVPRQRVSMLMTSPPDEQEQVVTIEASGYGEQDPPLAGEKPYPLSVLHESDPADAVGDRYTVTIERHDAALEESVAMVDLVDRRLAAREEASRLAAEEKASRQSAAVLALVNRRLAVREEAARLAAAETAARLAALYRPRQRPAPFHNAQFQASPSQAASSQAAPAPDAGRAQVRTAPQQPESDPFTELTETDQPEYTGRIAFVFLVALALTVGGSIAVWTLLGGDIQAFFNTVMSGR